MAYCYVFELLLIRNVFRSNNILVPFYRTKTFLTLMDLARKDPRILRKKSQMYLWNLLTVAVFYSLPVVQLVFTYQLVGDVYGSNYIHVTLKYRTVFQQLIRNFVENYCLLGIPCSLVD